MTTNSRSVTATTEDVWSIVADGWLYPLWVVGATRMRDVDTHWPATGTQIHHSFGVWPAVINDTTEVVDSVPGERLRLRARGWPMGEAEVLVEMAPNGEGCDVVMHEDVVRGPGRLVPRALRDPLLTWRNVETLRRLAFLAEGRARPNR